MSEISKMGYVVVTDFVPNDGSRDVADGIQAIIDANPNRTIYFPDGVYLLSHPICTPAEPTLSVDLQLSNYAILRAAEGWNSEEAMVRLGGIHPANNIRVCGSNYSLTGGIIDGSGVADGISIDSGRETAIFEVSIKHTRIGIHIKHGANSNSSDADIRNVNIVGNGALDSIGVQIDSCDNTLTNMRIANVFVGVDLIGSGNNLRYIHPLYTMDYTDYQNSCAFRDSGWTNWLHCCYSDQYAVGFRLAKSVRGIYDGCYCYWYASRGEHHTAVKADAKFNVLFTNFCADFRREGIVNVLLDEGEPGGKGAFRDLGSNGAPITGDAHIPYLRGEMMIR